MKRLVCAFALALASVAATAAPSNVPLPSPSPSNEVFVVEVYDVSTPDTKLISSVKLAAPTIDTQTSGTAIVQRVPYRSECADTGKKVECKSKTGEYGLFVNAHRTDDEQISVKVEYTHLNELTTFERGTHRIELPQVIKHSFDRALPLIPNGPPAVWNSEDNTLEYRLYWN